MLEDTCRPIPEFELTYRELIEERREDKEVCFSVFSLRIDKNVNVRNRKSSLVLHLQFCL